MEYRQFVDVQAEEFIPARVIPSATTPNIVKLWLNSRRDLLSVWSEEAYSAKVMIKRILARQVVIANSPAAVKHIMSSNHSNFERKSPQMRRALEYLLGDGLFISDGDTWARRRKLVAPIIHKNRLPVFAPVMVDTAGELAQRWNTLGDGATVDALVEMASLTMEIISRTVFGRHLGREDAMKVLGGFSEYQKRIDQFNLGYFFGFDEGLPPFKGRKLRQAAGEVHAVVDQIVSAHLQGKGDRDSILSMLVDAQKGDDSARITPEGMRNEAITIFMAGHETTAATLTWAWYLLSQAPWVERRLHDELDSVLGGRAPTLEDVRRLEYTRAVAEETLRLYPPVPLLSRQSKEEDVIGGRTVKPNSLVLVIPWLIHRHKHYWDRPEHFLPERFLDSKNRPNPFSYIAFSVGPRICTGASFGLAEVILSLAVLAQKFKLRLRPGEQVKPVCRLTLRPHAGMPMILERR